MHSEYRSGTVSGENRVVEDEARLLRRAGRAVHVVAPSIGSGNSAITTGLHAVWNRRRARQIHRSVHILAPNVVHAHNLFPALSPAVIRATAAERVPLIMSLHNFRLLCLPATFFRERQVCEDCLGRSPWPGVVHGCYRGSAVASVPYFVSLSVHRAAGTFDMVSRFVAVSEFVRNKHIQAGFDPDRVVVKPNFAWPAARRGGPGEYFLYLGRLSPEKGLDTLLSAWRPSLGRLVVVGTGPQESLLTHPPANVEFRGRVAPHEIPILAERARALVIPSLCYEAFPRAVVEAYAQGVPVIASRLGALAEVVEDGVSGVHFEAGNLEALEAAMERMLDDEESERLGEGAYRLWEERYTPEENLRQLEAIYADAMGSVGREPG